MKLHYFKDPHRNFGDDLNPWLWGQLIPDLLDDDDREVFVGIGTLLNHRLPAAPIKHVFGSGLGYGQPPVVDDRYIFHAVRGPATARSLGLAPDRAVTDSAILIRAVETRRGGTPGGPIGFIPTGQTITHFDWSPMCSQLGLRFISSRWEVEQVLDEMQACSSILCEAMHGAIVADALRIPWIAVRCNDDVLASKWQDWLATLSLSYEPRTVAALYDEERQSQPAERARNSIKRGLASLGLHSRNWTPPPPPKSTRVDIERSMQQLSDAARSPAMLGPNELVEAHTQTLLERLERLRQSRRPGA